MSDRNIDLIKNVVYGKIAVSNDIVQVDQPKFIIRKFIIKGFRIIKDLEIKNLSNFNVFIGKNNSGKSSILTALRYFLATSAGIGNSIPDKDKFWEFSSPEQIIIAIFEFSFSKLASKSHGGFILENERPWIISRELTPRGLSDWQGIPRKVPYHSDMKPAMNNILQQLCSQFRFLQESVNMLPNELVENAKEKNIEDYLRTTPDIETRIRSFFYYWKIHHKGKYSEAIENLDLIPVDFGNDPITEPDPNQNLTFQYNEFDRKFDVYKLGMGSKRILTLLFYLELSPMGIIIDEIENSLHSSLLKKLHSSLLDKSSEIQLFIATHSPIFLNKSELKSIYFIKRAKEELTCEIMAEDEVSMILDDIGVQNSDVLVPDAFIFCEDKYGPEIYSGFARFLCDYSIDRTVQFIEMGGIDNLRYYVALIQFLDKLAGYENIIYVVDKERGTKDDLIRELIRINSKFERRVLEKIIHVLSKRSIEAFLLNPKAISITFNFPKKEVEEFLLNNKDKKNKYYVLRNLVRTLSKDANGYPALTYKKKDAIEIIQNMDSAAIDPEIIKIIGRVSKIKT